MSWLGRLLLPNATFTLLAAISAAEALMLDWALRGLGAAALGVTFAAVAAANAGVVTLRRWGRGSAALRALFRGFVIWNLGAMFAAPLLVALFLAVIAAELYAGAPRGAGPLAGAWLWGGGASIAIGFVPGLWGFVVGQRRLRIDEVELPLRGLPRALDGLRIVQLSDLHIGLLLRAPELASYVERANALEPDLCVLTGDLFDFDPGFVEEGCRELAKLSARHGVFAVLGNHDVYTGAEAVAKGLAELTQIRLLRDEHVLLSLRGESLWLAGVEDPGRDWNERDAEHAALPRLASAVPRDVAGVLLAHRPSWFAQAASLGFPVVLSGHTHGGQIAPPPPLVHWNVARLIARWTRGYFELGDSALYVNRGLGVVGLPVRLNCPREISLLRLVPRE